MKSQYQLVGFINLFNIIPDFVFPVFKKGNELYFQEGENNYIKRFGIIKQNIIEKIIPLDNIYNNRPIIIGLDSQPIYAFQESKQNIIYGIASEIKRYFKKYIPLNNILKHEIADFLEDISSEKKI